MSEEKTEPQGGEDFAKKIEEYETRIHKMDAKISELLNEKKSEAAKRKEAEEAAIKAAEEAARKAGDVEAVEKSLRSKYAKELEARETEIKAATSQLRGLLVKQEAMRIAASYAVDSDSVTTLARLIETNLDMDVRDGEYTTIVKGPDGKPTGLTLDEFEKGLVQDKSLARLLKASDATGGGAKGSTRSGGAAQTVKANFAGSKEERIAALRSKFPELNTAS